MTFRHLIDTAQLDRSWIEDNLFAQCERLQLQSNGDRSHILNGRAMYSLFYEPSFLTRTSFERAIELLGGRAYHTEDASQFFPFGESKYLDDVINLLASLHFDLVLLRCSDPCVLERAEATDALPVINGGSFSDHPTQALADLYTLRRELGGVDGINIAIVGRLGHRNVNALLKGLALFDGVKVTFVPFSGQVNDELADYCQSRGATYTVTTDIEALAEVDAIYLNGPSTLAHAQLLKARNVLNLRIDQKFMSMLKSHCIIMDPMQRTGDFAVDVQDRRIACYRQAENALFTRMAVLVQMLG